MLPMTTYGRRKLRIYRHYGAAPLLDELAGGPAYRPLTRPQLMPQSTPLLLDAAAFAASRHVDQRRKHAGDEPYVNHVLQVAREISFTGGIDNAAVLAAAILHDVIEDSDTTADQIAERFGASVAEMVVECTDDKELPRKERRALQVEHAPNISPGAKLIKLADKLCNVRDIRTADDTVWSRKKRRKYIEWANEVVTALGQVNEALERAYWAESQASAAVLDSGTQDADVTARAEKKAKKGKGKKEKKGRKKREAEATESEMAGVVAPQADGVPAA
jgi:hypothetical protein